MSARFYALEARNAELTELLAALPEVAEPYRRRYEMSWLHHESALEGEVLTEAEIVQAIEHHVVGDASQMPVMTTIRNHRQAIARVRTEAQARRGKVTADLLVELHRILRGSARQAGAPRSRGGKAAREPAILRQEMPLHRTYTQEIAPPEQVEAELAKLIRTLGSVEFKELDPVRQAAKAHWMFMRVFPFADHNGKIARLLQTWYLLRAGFPPAIIHAVERQRYYEALRLPSAALRNLLLEALENSLESSIRCVEALRDGRLRRAASE